MLRRLLDGNRRFFTDAGTAGSDVAYALQVAERPNPVALVIGCMDSRVPPEVVFDQRVGDLLVVRTAGHVLDQVALASVELAVGKLGVPLIAVLGHEAGHLKGRHVLKQLVLSEAGLLVVFFLTHRLIAWRSLYTAFGFDAPRPEFGLLILGILWERLGFFLLPLYMAVSRRFERKADLSAARLLKTPEPLVTGLKRLAAENLSNLTPHPLYVRFHYSHPPLLERVASLEGIDLSKKAG